MFQDLISKRVHDYSENTSIIYCQQGRFFYDVHPNQFLLNYYAHVQSFSPVPYQHHSPSSAALAVPDQLHKDLP